MVLICNVNSYTYMYYTSLYLNVAKNSRSPREDDGESQRAIGMWDSYFVV